MSKMKPTKSSQSIDIRLLEQSLKIPHLKIPLEELYKSPKTRISDDWEIERLKQAITAEIASLPRFDEEVFAEFKVDINQIKMDIINNTNLLKTNNDLLLELINLLKLQASQAYFWSSSWINSEREAQDDIEKGNIHTFSTSSQIIKFLHND